MRSNYDFFMGAELAEHTGKWIAICNNAIVSEGDEPKKVFEEAKNKCKRKKILLTKVPEEATMIF